MTKTIVIADDHPFTAEGMERAIKSVPNLRVVDIVYDGLAAIAAIKKYQPDCAVLDLSMPGANGLEVYLEAKIWSPKTRFVIVTGISAAALFEDLYAAGIDGLFVKSALPEYITEGIARVCSGERVISPEAMEEIKSLDNSTKLTKREKEVLHALAKGMSNKKIADDLNVSHKTVDTHRTTILRKLNVNSTAALLVKAMHMGLLDI